MRCRRFFWALVYVGAAVVMGIAAAACIADGDALGAGANILLSVIATAWAVAECGQVTLPHKRRQPPRRGAR